MRALNFTLCGGVCSFLVLVSCAGQDGKAGTSCTVATESGTTTISCADGTSATLESGDDGAKGADGENGEDGGDGENGDDGDDGEDGENGEDGADGEVGSAGPQGHRGYSAHVANPFDGAVGYVNSEWVSAVEDAAEATSDATLTEKISAIAGTPTGVWLSKIADIAGTDGKLGLRAHLDAALDQSAARRRTVVVTLVVYDLPNRDCSAAASAGELKVSEDGSNRYRTEFIDPIAEILGDPKYSPLRIAAILEPDSLPNLVTNLGLDPAVERCEEAASSQAYEDGVKYAINELHPIPNVYLYADIGQSGWLGWSTAAAVDLYYDVLSDTDSGVFSIDGVVSNVSNYVPVKEEFLEADLYVGVPDAWDGTTGGPVRSVSYYSWNSFIDESSYAVAFRDGLVDKGFPAALSVLIDTSRNGWGGEGRPTELTAPEDLETIDPPTYVSQNRIDGRADRAHWCNPAGAGLGERPRTWPSAAIAAYVWVKPPGEADGTYDASVVSDPVFAEEACDVDHGGLAGAPAAGQWFQAQFEELVRNAYPPIQ